jgi:hypothetical protein
MEAGMGRVEERLISTYVHRVTDQYIKLHIPKYGLYHGKVYQKHLLSYLQTPYQPSPSYLEDANDEDLFEEQSTTSISNYIREKTELDFFELLMESCDKEEKIMGNISL